MGDTLEIFGKEFTNVAGFKAKDENGNTLIYTRGGSGGGGTITIEEIPNATGTTLQITTNGSSSGSTPSATQHTIHLEFSDETDTDIDVYYDNALIGTMITNYTPNPWTYNNKIVYYASLDNTQWLDNSITWETVWDGNMNFVDEQNGEDSYAYITALGNVEITANSQWRVTHGTTTRVHTAIYGVPWSGANAVWHINSTTDGTNGPYIMANLGHGAWIIPDMVDLSTHTVYVKIERATAS